MRYFICKAILENKIKPRTDKGEAELDQLAALSVRYINENPDGFLGCVTSVYKKECTLIFAGNGDDAVMQKGIAAFWELLGLVGELQQTQEVCANQISRELRMGSVDLPDDLNERFGITTAFRRLDADEHIARPKNGISLSEYAKQRHFPELAAEDERIHACAETNTFLGHPVHYIIEESDRGKAAEMIDLLVDTLYHAGRLQSARVILLDSDSFDRIPFKQTLSALYENFRGGTIVVSLSANGSDDDHADASEELIEKVCQFAVRHRHEVLTVFQIPQNNTEASRAIAAYLNNEMTMLTFSEEIADYEQSVEYMRLLCDEKQIADPTPFIEKIDAKQNAFYTAELETIFRNYYTEHLKQTHFPVYLACQNTAEKESKLEGRAADSLHDMIGLDKVKKVIGDSVSYY